MAANPARYSSRRRAAVAAGSWQPRTDGTDARQHLVQLAACGASYPEVAAAARLAVGTVRAAATGQRIATASEQAILGVTAAQLQPRRLDAGGAMLRLRALAAMGHTPTRVARAAALSPTYARELAAGRLPVVPRDVHVTISAVYERLWDKVPLEVTDAQRRAATGVRNRAEREGWAPPAGLDDERLDVPGYRPPRRPWIQAEGLGTAPDLDLEAGA
jgi:hypothetical protein